MRQDCTHSQTTGRVLHVRPQAAHEALQTQRHAEQTLEFRQQYALRSGIEGTLSQAVRAMGIRRSRYDGLARTHVGSGSHENVRPFKIIAMEKQVQTSIMHQKRFGEGERLANKTS